MARIAKYQTGARVRDNRGTHRMGTIVSTPSERFLRIEWDGAKPHTVWWYTRNTGEIRTWSRAFRSNVTVI